MIFQLEKYKTPASRHTCPDCGAKKQFSRYINTETGDFISEIVGRCNREVECGYHYKPKQFFADNPSKKKQYSFTPQISSLNKRVSYLNPDLITQSQNGSKCALTQFLLKYYSEEEVNRVIELYHLGVSKKWNDATVFWQIDQRENVRTGKIMLYDASTGKRIKEPYNLFSWVHSELKLDDFNLEQCFFGEHLLYGNRKPVGIVESEKTAIICAIHYSDMVWLATGGKSNLSPKKCTILSTRNVTLFPDKGCYQDWYDKAQELFSIAVMRVSNILEKIEAVKDGDDLADCLLTYKG